MNAKVVALHVLMVGGPFDGQRRRFRGDKLPPWFDQHVNEKRPRKVAHYELTGSDEGWWYVCAGIRTLESVA